MMCVTPYQTGEYRLVWKLTEKLCRTVKSPLNVEVVYVQRTLEPASRGRRAAGGTLCFSVVCKVNEVTEM